VVTHDVPANAIVVGNPAKIVGYSGAQRALPAGSVESGSTDTIVAGVTLHRLPLVEDLRGFLSFGEVRNHVPFEIKRYFMVFRVASEEIRGEHAHRTLHQFLICVHGRCHLVADDGENRQEFVLDSPAIGVHLPPMVWGAQYRYSKDAVLLALASDVYDPADYIRDYSEFLELRKKNS
jgi:dTDP-4-dehydrorhamnose 3,5-epimerase-like enzyme